ncbi:MAG TPA: hypothetical protein VGO01_20090, partial [Bradyrhizobium sp.]|nr:hypothetical protein [Bradyrhizobium sp.]
MGCTSRVLVASFILLAGIVPARHARGAAALERGTAITDPLALRELDRGRFGLRQMMAPERAGDIPLANSELFALPAMAPVRQALDGEFDRYIVRHRADLPGETIGIGNTFDWQLFDRAQLYSADTRFVLAGIVNRMDRAFVSESNCGEIRLIYRLTRTDASEAPD